MDTASKNNPPLVFNILIYVLVALFPAFWFYKQPQKLIAFLVIQAGILVFFLVYPMVGGIYLLSYLLLIHSVKSKI